MPSCDRNRRASERSSTPGRRRTMLAYYRGFICANDVPVFASQLARYLSDPPSRRRHRPIGSGGAVRESRILPKRPSRLTCGARQFCDTTPEPLPVGLSRVPVSLTVSPLLRRRSYWPLCSSRRGRRWPSGHRAGTRSADDARGAIKTINGRGTDDTLRRRCRGILRCEQGEALQAGEGRG